MFGLKQRQEAYLTRCETQLMTELNARSEYMSRVEMEKYTAMRDGVFANANEAIQWVQTRIVSPT